MLPHPRGGTPLVNGSVAEGARFLRIDGASANIKGYFRRQEPFYVYGVNHVCSGSPYPFIPSAGADSDTTGQVEVWLSEPLSTANVSALPCDNAIVFMLQDNHLEGCETLSQADLLASGMIRCHRCWCLVRLADADLHDEWHEQRRRDEASAVVWAAPGL